MHLSKTSWFSFCSWLFLLDISKWVTKRRLCWCCGWSFLFRSLLFIFWLLFDLSWGHSWRCLSSDWRSYSSYRSSHGRWCDHFRRRFVYLNLILCWFILNRSCLLNILSLFNNCLFVFTIFFYKILLLFFNWRRFRCNFTRALVARLCAKTINWYRNWLILLLVFINIVCLLGWLFIVLSSYRIVWFLLRVTGDKARTFINSFTYSIFHNTKSSEVTWQTTIFVRIAVVFGRFIIITKHFWSRFLMNLLGIWLKSFCWWILDCITEHLLEEITLEVPVRWTFAVWNDLLKFCSHQVMILLWQLEFILNASQVC